jgi:multisubunit Na+/H+ antiporter MnhE subunit
MAGLQRQNRLATEVAALANLVSLTRGVLALDANSDRQNLYAHATMFVDDPQTIRQNIERGMERRVLEALR